MVKLYFRYLIMNFLSEKTEIIITYCYCQIENQKIRKTIFNQISIEKKNRSNWIKLINYYFLEVFDGDAINVDNQKISFIIFQLL